MKKLAFNIAFAVMLFCVFAGKSNAQAVNPGPLQSNPWTANELLQPGILAQMISTNQKVRIYNIGVVQDIKGAINVGAASKKESLQKFAQALKTSPKGEMIVVYCGCCPFDKCPNIRPAFQLLKAQKFSKPYLLNLSTNLKTDWIGKGYPLAAAAK
ncbi:MAG TPA: hypothetical protein VK541_16755 [Pedobacter sp.]|uniref:rhodanese-like domain-containing protein n=1 Tax=Pedobacter sp. TaxID=1411316 RepID=UPI002C10D5FC|nr:rhodanese-like domain-containing protein [Pedobacter sp.]HMI04140.1 hypothetical protein [Pedobacter sp.]